MTAKRTPPRRRTTYRHGDLRHALVLSGTELARVGGPDAVVLRAATRQAGVAPNAAYRHFTDRQALLEAVCSAAFVELAVAIETELDRIPAGRLTQKLARARLRAVGVGYLRYAQAEPQLFRTAFSVPTDLTNAAAPDRAGNTGLTPFQLLNSALDDLVETGFLSSERRRGAEFLAWSAVHGLAKLLIDGPLRSLDDSTTQRLADRLLDMVDQGL